MAEVTREEFDALVARVTKLEGGPVTGPPSLVLVATPGTGYIDLSWAAKDLRVPIKKYWVGRDGKDDRGYGPWETDEPTTVHSRRFLNLVPGTKYKLHVDAELTDGTHLVAYVDSTPLGVSNPPVDPGVPPIPVEPGKSLLRPPGKRSGLPINLSLFKGGNTNLANMDSNPIGVKFDGSLSFNTRGQGWKPSMDDGLIAEIIRVQKAGGFFIVSMPHSMDPDADMNRKGQRNEYKTQQMAMAKYWKDKGVDPNKLIIRLCWEFNGGWYWWTAAAPGGTAALRDACKNFMDNWRSGGMLGTLFDCCPNMPSSASSASWRDLWLGKGYWDIFSIDQYDAYPAVVSSAAWEQKMVPVQSVRRCAQEALSFGVMWGIAECGNWWGPDGAGDNPIYYQFMIAEIGKFVGHLAYWNLYDDAGAPANLYHDWAHNPKSAAFLNTYFRNWKK
jgi:hypothetical protein